MHEFLKARPDYAEASLAEIRQGAGVDLQINTWLLETLREKRKVEVIDEPGQLPRLSYLPAYGVRDGASLLHPSVWKVQPALVEESAPSIGRPPSGSEGSARFNRPQSAALAAWRTAAGLGSSPRAAVEARTARSYESRHLLQHAHPGAADGHTEAVRRIELTVRRRRPSPSAPSRRRMGSSASPPPWAGRSRR